MTDQRGSMETCPTCGTTTISFDPPLVFEASEACGAIKPGTYTAAHPGGIPHCQLAKGHDDKHVYIVEYLEEWSDPAGPLPEGNTE